MFGKPVASDRMFGWQIGAIVGIGLTGLAVANVEGLVVGVTWTGFWVFVGAMALQIGRGRTAIHHRSLDAELKWGALIAPVNEGRAEEKELERMGETEPVAPVTLSHRRPRRQRGHETVSATADAASDAA